VGGEKLDTIAPDSSKTSICQSCGVKLVLEAAVPGSRKNKHTHISLSDGARDTNAISSDV